MSNEWVSDDFLRQWATEYRDAPAGGWASSRSAAIDELLQRRKDGQSPEEFVVLMAGRLSDVPDSERPMFLAALADIASGLRKVREALPR